MLWKMRLEDVLDKVVNYKQTVFLSKIEFLNRITIVSPLLPLYYSVVSVKASILLVVRDREDKDLPAKALCLFSNLLLILIGFLLNPKKGSDSNAITMHILSISYVEAFPTVFYFVYEKGEKHLQSDLRLVIN
jgi:hypothetical protein